MDIRIATNNDLNNIHDLWRELMDQSGVHPLFIVKPDQPAAIKKILEDKLNDPDGRIFLAEENGELAGMIITRFWEGSDAFVHYKKGYIAETIVLPKFRNKGVGQTLVNSAENWLKEMGADHVVLQVADSNSEGQNFWRRNGYFAFTNNLVKMLKFNYIASKTSSKRLTYDTLGQQHKKPWTTFMADEESQRFLGGFSGDAEQQTEEWFERINTRYNDGNGLVALHDKETGEFVGQAGLLQQEVEDTWYTEISFHIMPDERRKGYGHEAAAHCRDYAFNTLKLRKLICLIAVDNLASQAVALKIGMQRDRQVKFRDKFVYLYQMNNK